MPVGTNVKLAYQDLRVGSSRSMTDRQSFTDPTPINRNL